MKYKDGAEILLYAILMAAFVMGAAYIGGKQSCEAQMAEMNVDVKYNFWGGCLIRPEGEQEWFPLENYRWLAEP